MASESTAQPDQIPVHADNAHTPHCMFMNWGMPTETSCLCDPGTAADLHDVWGPVVMGGIAAATPGASSQVPDPTEPKVEYPCVSDPLEPVAPSLEIAHPTPIRAFKPAFLSVDHQFPQYTSTPEPEYPCQTPTSSAVESCIPSLSLPRPSSRISRSGSVSLAGQTRHSKRSRDAYEDEDEDEDEDVKCGDSISNISSSPKLTVRPTWRRRTNKKGSPNHLTSSYHLESSTPTRSSAGSPSKRETSSPRDFSSSPVPSEMKVKTEDEYKSEGSSFDSPLASPVMHAPNLPPLGFAPPPLGFAPPPLGYAPPPLGYAPNTHPLYQCMYMSFLATRMFQAGWAMRGRLEPHGSS